MPPAVNRRTRDSIVSAAGRLFEDHGYRYASMTEIARTANVSLQTVYNAVGSKSDVLFAVLERAAAGPDAPTPIPVFMQERTERETDPQRILEVMTQFFAGALQRTAPIRRLIRE